MNMEENFFENFNFDYEFKEPKDREEEYEDGIRCEICGRIIEDYEFLDEEICERCSRL